ncbi:VRR-NUC domain-containing protein [Candidatus Marinimicrobia bacterium MT.SAG.3]|nr:VRR-NUC domain-containing protein [Candidatus Marinimicrobia bacterium MT.SAG.3]
MTEISSEIEVTKISLNRKLNPAKGWSEWYVAGEYFAEVEDAVIAHFSQTKEYEGLRTSYKVWRDAFSSIDLKSNRKKSGLATLLQSLNPNSIKALKRLIRSTERRGAPDLLLKHGDKFRFAEVKVSDSLSNQQLKWLEELRSIGFETFVIRVTPSKKGIQLKKNEFIIREFEKSMFEYINSSESPNAAEAFAHAKRALTNFEEYSINSTLEFEADIHRLFGNDRLEITFSRLINEKDGDSR